MAGKIKFQVVGAKEAVEILRSVPDVIRKPVQQAVRSSAMLVHGTAIKSLHRGTPTGRVYKKYNPRRIHVASAPGQPPASDTGHLAEHTRWTISRDGLTATVGVGSTAKYGRYLEFGTTDIEPRPWLYPALAKNKKSIIKRIRVAIAKVLKNKLGKKLSRRA